MTPNRYINYFLIIVLITLVIYFGRKVYREIFPGDYPMVTPTAESEFIFGENEIIVKLSATTKNGNIIVYAYGPDGNFYGMLKPIKDLSIIIRKGDNADFMVQVYGREIGETSFMKKMDRYIRKVGMYDLLIEAVEKKWNYGVQNCLYPICTRCTDGCKSVVSTSNLPLVMSVMDNGEIKPVFRKGRCPRCGKCIIWCPSGVIQKEKQPWEK